MNLSLLPETASKKPDHKSVRSLALSKQFKTAMLMKTYMKYIGDALKSLL